MLINDVILAWKQWDKHPGSETPAYNLVDKLADWSKEIQIPVPTIRREVSKLRRQGIEPAEAIRTFFGSRHD